MHFLWGTLSVGYAIAHPRLNPVGILPPGSRPSDAYQTQPYTAADTGITGIANITNDANDNAPVYFDLLGRRVTNPQNGLYMRRQGNRVTKVYIP